MEILEIEKFIKDKFFVNEDHRLLYLCKYGSHLYGTNTKDSDVDYKGIFLPSKESLLLGNNLKSFHNSTGKGHSRNTNEDIDVDLWSLHYFINLVKKGDTNAIDLLYSPTNENCVIYKDYRLDEMFDNPLEFFNPIYCHAYIGYAIGQAKKYGIKGSRLGILKQIYKYLIEKDIVNDEILMENKLSSIVEDILDKFYDDSYCFMKIINGEESLVLCGKVHLFSIKIKEFWNRVEREYKKYGERSELAEQNEGIDWKALSHAVRSLMQMEMLLTKGYIDYPLNCSDELKDIKKGKFTFNYVENLISNKLEEIKELQKTSKIKGKINNKLIKNFILKFYQ